MRRFFKILIYTVLAIIILLFFVVSLLYLPAVQEYARKQTVKYFTTQFGWDVRIGNLSVQFPLDVVVEDVFVAKNPTDTLLSANYLRLNVGIQEILWRKLVVDELTLHTGKFGMSNDSTGMQIKVAVDTLLLRTAHVNLNSREIEIKNLQLADGFTYLTTGNKTTTDTVASKPFNWTFRLEKAEFRRVAYRMETLSLPCLAANIGDGMISGGEVNIGEQLVNVDTIMVRQGACILKTASDTSSVSQTTATKATASQTAWTVRGGTVAMDNSTFTMSTGTEKKMEIILSGIGVRLDSVYNRGTVVRAELRDLKMVQQDGIQITEMNADVDLDTTSTRLTGAYIRTRHSLVKLNVHTKAPVTNLMGSVPLFVKLDAKIGMADLVYFYDKLPEAIIEKSLAINTSFYMTDNRITVDHLMAAMPGHLNLTAKGKVSSFRHLKEVTGEFDLQGELPDVTFVNNMLKNRFVIPRNIALNFAVKAGDGLITPQLKLTQGKGVVTINGSYHTIREIYDVRIALDSFRLDRFMPHDSLGTVTASLHADGRYFTWEKAEAQLKLEVKDCFFKQHNYQKITLNSNLKKTRFNGVLKSEDPDLALDLFFKADSVNKSYALEIEGEIGQANLTGLHLMQPALTVSLGMNIKATLGKGNVYTLQSVFDKIKMTDHYGKYNLGDIAVNMDSNPVYTQVDILSGDFRLGFRADTVIKNVVSMFSAAANVARQQIDRKDINMQELQKQLPVFVLNIEGAENNTISRFLKSKNIGFKHFSFRLDSPENSDIRLISKIDRPYLNKVQFDSIRMDVTQQDKKLDYSINIANSTATLKDILNVNISGMIQKDQLRMGLKQKDKQGQIGLDLGVNLVLCDTSLAVSFFPIIPIIAYKRWIMNADNQIVLMKNRKIEANLKMTYQDKLFSIMSLQNEGDKRDRLQMELKGIDLADVSMITPFIPDISGLLNVDLSLYTQGDHSGVDGNIRISDFYYTEQRIGSVDLAMNYALDSTFTGHSVDFVLHLDSVKRALVKGQFSTSQSDKRVQIDLDIPSLPLQLVDIFVPDHLIKLGGELNGKIRMDGTLDKPIINGDLAFRDGQAEVTMLGTAFGLDKNQILLKNSRVLFNQYKLIAPDKSTLAINGYMDISSFSHIMTDLSLNGKNFQVVNVKQNPNSMIYGKAYANVNATLKGEFSSLDVTGNVSLLNNTVIDYTLRSSTPELQDRSLDLVRFVSFRDTTKVAKDELVNRVSTNSFNLNMLIEIGNNVSANINLSEDGSDRVSIQGGGNLIYGINPESGSTLVGKYTLTGGTVVYNVPVAGRKVFAIQNGSFVEWTGNLANPRLNIAASESVKANVMEADQPSRLVTFESIIRIQNTLQQLEISFDLSAPNDMSIQNQLATFSPEERTKQAMNLLIYRSYTGPGAVSSSSTAANTANNTLYGFVEGELNKYTQKTGLTFGVDSYNQTSSDGAATTRTDYTYQFSKQLFNDKVNVKIGGRISTDNGEAAQNMQENLVDDIAIEYVFDKSRNLYLKVFRHTNYESVLEGEVTQTGIGVVLRKSFRKIKDLFIRKSKREEQQKQ